MTSQEHSLASLPVSYLCLWNDDDVCCVELLPVGSCHDNMRYTDASWLAMVGLTILHLHDGMKRTPTNHSAFHI